MTWKITPQREHYLLISGIALLFLGILFFHEQVRQIFSSFIAFSGLAGLFTVIFVLDTFIQPIPPDLFVFGSTLTGVSVLAITLTAGAASVCAGAAGYFLGRKLWFEETAWYERVLFWKHKQNKIKKLFDRYGAWAVGIASLTPLPYSATCWAAGAFRMPFHTFIIVATIARFPRFLFIALLGYSFS